MQSSQFISPVSDRFNCNICTNVLREPKLTVCCGQHYCSDCLKQWFGKQRKESCPHCRAEGSKFQHVPNRSLNSEINQLKINCSNRTQGCTWNGELGDLKTHMESRSGCRYETVDCTNKCGTKNCRKDLDTHLRSSCPLRLETCQYCKKQDTHRAMQSHKDACPKAPVSCPNGCSLSMFRAFTRENLQAHLSTCSKARKPCPFEEVGCTVRDKPDELKKHLTANQAQHLTMLMESSKKVLVQLKETKEELQETKQELAKTNSKLEMETELLSSLKRGLAFEVNAIKQSDTENERIGAFRSIQSMLEEEELENLDSLIFRVIDFVKHFRDVTIWYSAPFIIEGFKVCVGVHPKGVGVGLGTHASFSLILLDIVSSSPNNEDFTGSLDDIRVLVPLSNNRVHRSFLKEVKGALPFDLSPLKVGEKRRILGTIKDWIPHIIVKAELEGQSFMIKIERGGDFHRALFASAMRASALSMAAREDCRTS
ncbi:TNF receptor-associated factor 3-like [Halichondria panicea]|uniref:TNF receptor-associated factor 3-like n=1 Tax=Halichondria panicea TaxID=6063 RepID=UPI00312BC00E